MLEIQISNPAVLKKRDEEDTNIEEAIETIFPLDTEYAIMIWDNFYIPLSYKHDISFMINDILLIIKFLKSDDGQIIVPWASNTFSTVWDLKKNGENIHIGSVWNSVRGGLVVFLNSKNNISVNKDVLYSELKKLVSFVKKSLKYAGYNSENLNDFDMLNC